MTNPLLDLEFDIPFARVEAAHVEPAVDSLLETSQRAVDAIAEGGGARTYDGTLGALESATESLELAMTVVDHLESVATTDALREAYNAARPRVSAFWSELAMNAKLYEAVREFAATDEAATLDATRKRFLDKTLDDFRRHGAELDDDGKRKLHAIDVELTQLTTQFSQNVLDETNAFELMITDEAQLAGLPESAQLAAAESAKAKGVEGWRFTLQAPSLIPLLTYLDDSKIRETVWRAYNTRATSGARDNRPVIERIVELRNAKARLLGYTDFSDLVTEDRMAKSGSQAQSFIDDLRTKTRDAFERENATLEAYQQDFDADATMQPWDVAYYAEKQRQAEYDFNEEALRPYFPLERVLNGLFATAQALYGIRIVEREASTWDDAVQSYAILDEDDEMLAAFYVDLFPRENKRGGAWMNGLIASPYRDGQSSPHLGLFCANVNPPVGETPALLTHREVETLFHEFGHLLHHCLSRVSVRSLAGTNVAWDFVELPSQIMENWCWERSGLDLFAAHYETGEAIPDDLYRKMIRARAYRAANAQMRQLGLASVDLALHREYESGKGLDAMTFGRAILEAHSPAKLPADYGMLAGFTHVFAHPIGYASGYYSYKWAEVLDADAFTRFKQEGITSPAVGRDFREKILAKGDSEDPAKLYRDFMGRAPRLEPLLERAGLS